MFQKIDMEKWERREHYEYYRTRLRCGYSLTAAVDVTEFVERIHRAGLKFYPSFVFCAASAVNARKEFRMGVAPDQTPGYWDVVHPCYTIFHEDDHTFSDMWSIYHPDFKIFYDTMISDMKEYGHNKGIKAKAGQPQNFFCISCVPWLDYTGCSTYCADSEPALFPVITFGQYTEKNGRIQLPLTVTISHAAADGYHTCMLIRDIQKRVREITFEK